MAKAKTKFFQNRNFQLVYGIVLFVLIISIIAINSIVVFSGAKTNLDVSLQRHTLYLSRLFSATTQEYLDDHEALQQKLNNVRDINPEIANIDVLVKKGEVFEVVASFDEQKVGSEVGDVNYILSWAVDDGIATKIVDYREGKEGGLWEVVIPFRDISREKQALLVTQISYDVVSDLEKSLFTRSMIALVVSLIIVMLLLSLNLRLFEYTVLFKKLKEVDQMKDEFISIASHELRTPITTIKGFLSMLLEGDYGNLGEEGTKTLKIMDASVKRLGSLVEDLLNVSRIEQNRLKLSPKRVKTLEILNSINDEFQLRTKEKNLGLRLQIPNDLPDTFTDEDKFRQILVNLVGNSVKYTKKGEIDIIAKQTDKKFVTITIKDTGIGMSAKEREQLFSKFYRIEGEETKGIVGTGLGLWITKQLVELQGGEIFVESIKHVGSKFDFTVPIYTGQADDKEVK